MFWFQDARDAGFAKWKVDKKYFTMKKREKKNPSSFTFVVTAQSIQAEHVVRPTWNKSHDTGREDGKGRVPEWENGERKKGDAQVWTKLTLPGNFAAKVSKNQFLFKTHYYINVALPPSPTLNRPTRRFCTCEERRTSRRT